MKSPAHCVASASSSAAPHAPRSVSRSSKRGRQGRPAEACARHGARHGRHGVGVAADGDRGADRLPVVVGRAEEGVQAPRHAGHDERRDPSPFAGVPWVEAGGVQALRGRRGRQRKPVRHHRDRSAHGRILRAGPLRQRRQHRPRIDRRRAARQRHRAGHCDRAGGAAGIQMGDSALLRGESAERPHIIREATRRAARPASRSRCRRTATVSPPGPTAPPTRSGGRRR